MKLAVAVLVASSLIGCEYVVVPPDEGGGAATSSKGWSGIATAVGPSDDGGLRVELTIRNETGDWSAMEADASKPATLTADGKSTSCSTVVVGTGGHRLAPGLQMRGFVAGTKAKPTTELIHVECPGADATPGSKLAIDYQYVTGEYNYYDPDANEASGRLEVDLDKVATDLTYPIAEPVEGLVQPRDVQITGLNDVVLSLTGAKRTEEGLELAWRTSNPASTRRSSTSGCRRSSVPTGSSTAATRAPISSPWRRHRPARRPSGRPRSWSRRTSQASTSC